MHALRFPKSLCTRASLFSLALVPVLSAQEPRFDNPVLLANREVALTLTAPNGQTYCIDASSDLTQWVALASLPVTAGQVRHTDSGAPWARDRFYVARQVTSSTALTGDHLPAAGGDVVIHPVFHSSLALSWSNQIVYIDPAANSYAGLPKADLILYTHDHADHFVANAIPSLTNAGVRLCASPGVYAKLPSSLRSLTVALSHGATTNLKGIGIEALPAYNLANTPHAKGTNNNGYILTLGGRRLYIAGDTENTPEMLALENIDVAFLPMNQPYTMTVTQAAAAANAFRPKIVYPYHYRNANGSFADLESFKSQIDPRLQVEVRLRKWY
ncbi:MAG TPA: MBL fold metallo-hydrolase [Verrucomicrobiota bacterium]|nr:MBL fold metallo-hydrolase [Verrucomicrobiota bacterium]HNU53258.1 MBL fold metallo-hydrolase [Verrucomicrobiota bacterium]